MASIDKALEWLKSAIDNDIGVLPHVKNDNELRYFLMGEASANCGMAYMLSGDPLFKRIKEDIEGGVF
jgi:hypothetical protein